MQPSACCIPEEGETLEEIDEALAHASRTKTTLFGNANQLAIVDDFINDLLERRLELQK
jgi:hypothetical protein